MRADCTDHAVTQGTGSRIALRSSPGHDDAYDVAVESDLSPGLHFAGVNTWLLLRYLRDHEGADGVARVLRESAERRTADELSDLATWSSYEQFRRLLEVTASFFGGAAVERVAGGGLTDPSMPEMTAMLQSLGSPESLLAMITESGGAGLAPVIELAGHQADTNEWVVHESFVPGFEPFPEYCAWAAGLYSNIPALFGLRADVVKTACACEGAEACEYRIRWFPDDETVDALNFEARIQVLTARLEALQETVNDLVSDDDLERVLAESLCRRRVQFRRLGSYSRWKRCPLRTSMCTRRVSATTRPRASHVRSWKTTALSTNAGSLLKCNQLAVAMVDSPRLRPRVGISRRSGSYFRPTPGWSPPRSIRPPRSRMPVVKPRRPARFSSSRTRSPRSRPPTTWLRRSRERCRQSWAATDLLSSCSNRTRQRAAS